MNIRHVSHLTCLLVFICTSSVFAAGSEPAPKPKANPASEAALRRSIEEVRAGAPDYEQMSPQFAAAVRQQLPQVQALFKSWGAIKGIDFKGSGAGGVDTYEVTFENASAQFMISLAPDGKIAGEGVRPAGAPEPPEMVGLPEEGAPKAQPGPYQVVAEPAVGAPGLKTFRPDKLDRFSRANALPVVIWGNGGCAMDSPVYTGFLSTIASHGFLVITTTIAPQDAGAGGPATADDLKVAIDWAEKENRRTGAPLNGRIETQRVAVMGQSCGGGLAISLGADPRVTTIGVFNFGVQPQTADAQPPGPELPTAEALKALHGPVLLINGHQRDFMMAPSKATFDAIESLPVFYGARHDAGHLGTMGHPGGGEFANVASSWALWQLKGDKVAGAMFLGAHCGLCTNSNWEVQSRHLVK